MYFQVKNLKRTAELPKPLLTPTAIWLRLTKIVAHACCASSARSLWGVQLDMFRSCARHGCIMLAMMYIHGMHLNSVQCEFAVVHFSPDR